MCTAFKVVRDKQRSETSPAVWYLPHLSFSIFLFATQADSQIISALDAKWPEGLEQIESTKPSIMESWEISIPADMDLDIGNGRHPPSPAGLSNLNPDLMQDRKKERKTFLPV